MPSASFSAPSMPALPRWEQDNDRQEFRHDHATGHLCHAASGRGRPCDAGTRGNAAPGARPCARASGRDGRRPRSVAHPTRRRHRGPRLPPGDDPGRTPRGHRSRRRELGQPGARPARCQRGRRRERPAGGGRPQVRTSPAGAVPRAGGDRVRAWGELSEAHPSRAAPDARHVRRHPRQGDPSAARQRGALTRPRIALGLALVLAAARAALGAPPVLETRTTCDDAALEPGAARDVPIELTGGGQAIGALGFTLRFDPALLEIRPQDLTKGEASQRAGTDVMPLAGSTPGTIRVQVVPTVQARVAPIPDGEVVRLHVRVPADVAASCTALTLEAATFHDTVAGFRIAGTVSNGSLATISCASRTSLPGVRCRIATVLDLLRQAPTDAIAKRTRKKLTKLATRILSRVDK